jgi:hypothetical protein
MILERSDLVSGEHFSQGVGRVQGAGAWERVSMMVGELDVQSGYLAGWGQLPGVEEDAGGSEIIEDLFGGIWYIAIVARDLLFPRIVPSSAVKLLGAMDPGFDDDGVDVLHT